jgi:hypothetical protein
MLRSPASNFPFSVAVSYKLIVELRQAPEPYRRQGLRYVTDGYWAEDDQGVTFTFTVRPRLFR